MRRVLLPVVLAAVVASPAAAGAFVIAPGPDGRALLATSSRAGVELVERTASGGLTRPRTIMAGRDAFEVLSAWAPDGAAIVVAYDQSVDGARKLVVLRRPAGAGAFGAPTTIVQGSRVQLLAAAADPRGDMAILAQVEEEDRPVLLTAARGGAFGPPIALPAQTDGVALAVGGRGRVAVAYDDDSIHKTVARVGTIGGALGPPRRFEHTGLEAAAAVDDAGVATVVFSRTSLRSSGPAPRPAPQLLVASRARPGQGFGPAVAVAGTASTAFASIGIAAAGTTTALTFDPSTSDPSEEGRHGVAIARGSGRFGPVQRPSARPSGTLGQFGWPMRPAVAVDRAGDVLLAYAYGVYGEAVHVSERRARETRFSAPRVLSTLGRGGWPVPALLTDRTALVAWSGPGGLRLRSDAAARPLDLAPPRATIALPRDTVARLLARNTFRARIACSKPCILEARAALRTKTGTTFETIRTTMRRAGAVTRTFAFNSGTRAGHARAGSRLRLTVAAENASGFSSEVVRSITLRARR